MYVCMYVCNCRASHETYPPSGGPFAGIPQALRLHGVLGSLEDFHGRLATDSSAKASIVMWIIHYTGQVYGAYQDIELELCIQYIGINTSILYSIYNITKSIYAYIYNMQYIASMHGAKLLCSSGTKLIKAKEELDGSRKTF